MAKKAEIAEQIAKLENPDADEEQIVFLTGALERGFRKDDLETRLQQALNGDKTAAGEAEPAPEGGAAVPGTELEPTPAALPDSTLPDFSAWAQMQQMAKAIAGSKLCPDPLRREPDSVLLVLLGAHDLGIPSTQALSKLVVVDGKLSMMAELMVGLVMRAGHRIWPAAGNDGKSATAVGQRREEFGEWGPEVRVSFTLEDAADAGLVTIGDDHKPRARSSSGKKLPWELYTPDLLWARAVSRLCRRTFPDCLSGVSYTPDELGYIESDDSTAVSRAADEEQATITLNEQRSQIAARISNLPGDERKALAEWWSKMRMPRTAELTGGGIRQVLRRLEEAEQRVAATKADEPVVEEAELVDENAEEGDGPVAAGGEVQPGDRGPVEGAAAAPSPSEAPMDCDFCGKTIDPDPGPVFDDSERPHHIECLAEVQGDG